MASVNNKPIWLKRNKEEVEAIAIKLAKQGISPEKIGLILRDSYGVPSMKLVAGKISRIISKNLEYKPTDLVSLENKAAKLRKHIEKNKLDKVAKRDLGIISARIKKLQKYYSRRKSEK